MYLLPKTILKKYLDPRNTSKIKEQLHKKLKITWSTHTHIHHSREILSSCNTCPVCGILTDLHVLQLHPAATRQPYRCCVCYDLPADYPVCCQQRLCPCPLAACFRLRISLRLYTLVIMVLCGVKENKLSKDTPEICGLLAVGIWTSSTKILKSSLYSFHQSVNMIAPGETVRLLAVKKREILTMCANFFLGS